MYYTDISPNGQIVIINLDKNIMISFTENPSSVDWIIYQEWLSEGNTPLPWPPNEGGV